MAHTAADRQLPNTLGLMIVAAAAGAVTALLLAPKRGSEMREDIRGRYNDAMNKAHTKVSEGAETMRSRAADVADKARSTVNRAADKTKDAADTAADKAKDTADTAASRTKSAASSTGRGRGVTSRSSRTSS